MSVNYYDPMCQVSGSDGTKQPALARKIRIEERRVGSVMYVSHEKYNIPQNLDTAIR